MENFQNIRIAVDAIVFGYKNNSLYVLLIEQKFGSADQYWALPGGLVKNDESLSDAVIRELHEETNVQLTFMEQLYTFGDDIYRDSRNRVISVAYYALVDASNLEIKADSDAEKVQWFKIDAIPTLAFDHNLIIEKAISRLKAKLTYEPIGFDLLPPEFLFSDLENLYCTILEKEIDRRNFRKKILSYGFLEQTDHFSPVKNGRPAKLFRFNKLKYNALLEQGFHFEIKFA
ncbi:NUDIX domain-containing protein [Flavobacterium sp. Fl-77]|uniref:NUDIX domain-containing protein n=1 Tax=Flavobacterium flavipigmentatum TaxID=2893884 RepID=A0AAJ2S8B1_9FLAO|nr:MULTISPECIES: NUDIX domain-containing protein [unclassified Flavobacterium]MDX6180769.1 NUDIX domain-containing protein [Flavobacterium sp. Fl-33]MDX6184369.1 NUDIX domain-containing protein [Flavobacterium sp. Fl-77]UFH39478.1 NUDIX hydrolase [Flavobacterium sp. F-70]